MKHFITFLRFACQFFGFCLSNIIITKLSRENEANEKIQLLYAAIRKYDAVWELTPEVLTDFIEKIEVGQVSAENKKISFELRDNQIYVFFWGVGIIDFM